MSEGKKLLRPMILIFTSLFMFILLWDFHSVMYQGEYIIRDVIRKLYAYAAEQEQPTQWLREYREDTFAEIEKLQKAFMATRDAGEWEKIDRKYDQEMSREGMFSSKNLEILALNQLVRRFEHIDDLASAWEREALLAKRAAKRGNIEAQDKSLLYGQLEKPGYGIYQPYEDMIGWNQRNSWLFLALLCSLSSWLFTMEYKGRMYSLISVQAYRPWKVPLGKNESLLVFLLAAATIWFVMETAIVFYMLGGTGGWNEPAQALYCMSTVTAPIRIWQLIVAQYCAVISLGIFIIGLAGLISTFLYSLINVVFACAGLIGSVQGVSTLFPKLLPVKVTGFLGAVDMVVESLKDHVGVCAVLSVCGIMMAAAGCVRFGRGRSYGQI